MFENFKMKSIKFNSDNHGTVEYSIGNTEKSASFVVDTDNAYFDIPYIEKAYKFALSNRIIRAYNKRLEIISDRNKKTENFNIDKILEYKNIEIENVKFSTNSLCKVFYKENGRKYELDLHYLLYKFPESVDLRVNIFSHNRIISSSKEDHATPAIIEFVKKVIKIQNHQTPFLRLDTFFRPFTLDEGFVELSYYDIGKSVETGKIHFDIQGGCSFFKR